MFDALNHSLEGLMYVQDSNSQSAGHIILYAATRQWTIYKLGVAEMVENGIY